MSRASRSVPPPAGNGTPIFTGRDGKLCASAPDASAMAASRPISGAVILFILVLLPAAQILFPVRTDDRDANGVHNCTTTRALAAEGRLVLSVLRARRKSHRRACLFRSSEQIAAMAGNVRLRDARAASSLRQVFDDDRRR